MRRAAGLAFLLAATASGGAEAERPAGVGAGTESRAGAEPLPLDRRAAYYREDADGRRVARLEATLVRDGEGVRLRLSASAVDPLVEPPRGDGGVAGSNEVTARELTALLEGRRLGIRARGADGRRDAVEARATDRGRVRLRRVEADGRVRLVPASARDQVLGFAAESAPLARGVSVLDVVADGRVVVRATVAVTTGGARVRALECLGEAGPLEDAP